MQPSQNMLHTLAKLRSTAVVQLRPRHKWRLPRECTCKAGAGLTWCVISPSLRHP